MGKIDETDISGIVEEFEKLDYDESRTMTTSDIVLAQMNRDLCYVIYAHHLTTTKSKGSEQFF
ncbi:hypothetical protein YC2023_006248 [Brassica napus]